MLLYSPPPGLGDASAAGILAEVTRRQRVRQLTNEIMAACTTAGAPFYWLRVQGFDQLAAALDAGASGDPSALAVSLDETYSQVLEAVLSSLDRQLVMPSSSGRADPEPLSSSSGGGGGSGTAGGAPGPQQQNQQQQGPGLPPGGLAPGHAPPEEWAAAMRVLQGACVLHGKTRAVLGTAQYLQLLVNRACSCPPAAPPALDALLAITAASPEAQALLAGNGGIDAVVALARGRTARPGTARGGGGAAVVGGPPVPRGVRLRCLGFLHVFVGHVLARGVRAGVVHPNTQRSSQQLLQSELGQAAAELLCRSADGALAKGAAAAAGPAAPPRQSAAEGDGGGSGGGGAAGQESGGGAAGQESGGGVGGSALDAVAEAALAAMEGSGRVRPGG
ncbi:hypothetical protein Rsub_03227 [Raphidocelis subcapitata]|uniref:Uncharacterized protein n=1 Tax=Raphidocelis subcapitata TaxID=307507 RepID=A0A2V0P0P1_9CHLO|nr:hypothetical protein Rsub_03227 [Raphidocelis subcapitata]|eukprot:GBF90655.1 hypothetical protein Rsub_03227 [Raphidocelis subcapitata]